MFPHSGRLGWFVSLCLTLGACSPAPATVHAARSPAAVATARAERDAGGVGSLTARTDRGETLLLRLESVHVVAEQRGDMALVEVTHRFFNDSDQMLEGTFRFPMPDGALLTGLALQIDDKLVEGELVEREKAKKAYEAVVDGMQDPALLEWEHGSIFKLRVFPLEPGRPKLVKLRYLTPLRRTADGLEFVQGTGGPSGSDQPYAVAIDWQGKRVVSEQAARPDRTFVIPAQSASSILVEKRAEASYAAVRLAPDWSRVPPASTPVPKHWFVVVDTSRSALEEFPRSVEALGVMLSQLPAGSDFEVVTSDLTAEASKAGLLPATTASIEATLAALRSVSPDGASDLGQAFALVGRLAKGKPDSAVLYLGDCEPTWGLTKATDLRALLERELPHVPVYPVLFGASIDDRLAEDLATSSGGRYARIRRPADIDAFTATLGRPVPRLRDFEIKAAPGVEVLTNGPLSLEPGGELLLFTKAPPGADPLAGLKVSAKTKTGSLDLLPRVRPEQASSVGSRFGAALVEKLERSDAAPAEVVKASLDYGVMSRFTSFLVLESEEAYARFAIERRRRQLDDAPHVTGKDLEGADGADISADRIQPGDPEIVVDAERDALKVTVDFAFGETKRATYDFDARGGRGAWMVRFLVPRDTKEGTYEAVVHVFHRDGTVELRSVSYTVDRTAPELSVKLEPSRRHPGRTVVIVSALNGAVTSDLRRVELRTPRGQIHELVAIRWGVFRAVLPSSELEHGTLRVVGFDQAQNHATEELELP
jgi:hypothetical protein